MKHWSIRHRILASFGLILALMAFMAGIAYTRLVAIDQEANSVETDSTPGLYYSTMLRGAWFESYQLLQQAVAIDDNEKTRAVDLDALRAAEARIDGWIKDYGTTVNRATDRAQYDEVRGVRQQYSRVVGQILKLTADGQIAAARALTPAARSSLRAPATRSSPGVPAAVSQAAPGTTASTSSRISAGTS